MMGYFRKKEPRQVPSFSTASLPDLIFILLFFFIAVTSLRHEHVKVNYTTPQTDYAERVDRRSLITYIYIGVPQDKYRKGSSKQPGIQLDNNFVSIDDIRPYLLAKRSSLSPADRNKMTVCLKIDKQTKMGIVMDVKEAIRQAYVLNIVYLSASPNDKSSR